MLEQTPTPGRHKHTVKGKGKGGLVREAPAVMTTFLNTIPISLGLSQQEDISACQCLSVNYGKTFINTKL